MAVRPLFTPPPLPRSVIVIAWVFMIVGALSLADWLVCYFGLANLRIDPNVFLLFIGPGLLKRSEFSRRNAVTWCGVHIVFGMTLASSVLLLKPRNHMPIPIVIGFFVLLCILDIWVMKTLADRRVSTLFCLGGIERNGGGRWQFGLPGLLVLTVFAAGMCASAIRRDVLEERITNTHYASNERIQTTVRWVASRSLLTSKRSMSSVHFEHRPPSNSISKGRDDTFAQPRSSLHVRARKTFRSTNLIQVTESMEGQATVAFQTIVTEDQLANYLQFDPTPTASELSEFREERDPGERRPLLNGNIRFKK